ncbi:hypothetical protein [Nocardioides sp. KR10-350]|uniref:hypothetical protein n=1 Tax=Nocardioides cheoyonin TaxID=3156615 RepID=UPI0032B4C09D
MSWLAILLVGLGVTDLVRSVRRVAVVPECVGAGAAVLLGLLCELTEWRDALAYVVVAAVVVAWGRTSRLPGTRAAVPLALLGTALVAGLLLAPWAPDVTGPVADWLQRAPWLGLATADPAHTLLVLGGVLVQLSTGNVVVRLVLEATGAQPPQRPGQRSLKGGRLLGPMERLVILGLGLAGHVTAASLVIAAKGLVRWPELQSFRDTDEPSIDEVTEYFLVGSFVSWLTSLGTLVLLAG